MVEPVHPPYGELARRVGAVMRDTPGTSCVVEHFLAKTGDPFLSELSTHVLSLDQEVYFALALEDLPTTIAQSLSWHGTLGVGSPREDPLAAGTFSSSDVRVFAASAQLVAIKAYDGSGFLVWIPSATGN